jgi:hypothetical protein
MTNNYNNEEDNIRAPDNVFRERLIDDDDDEYDSWFQLRNNNDNDLEQAIAESFRIYNENNTWNDFDNNNTDNDLKDNDIKGVEEMKQNDLFPIFKLNIKKLIHFDKQLKELYEKILPILDLYERGEIDHHLMDYQEYQVMFGILRSVRIPKEEWVMLETIFIKELK